MGLSGAIALQVFLTCNILAYRVPVVNFILQIRIGILAVHKLNEFSDGCATELVIRLLVG